MFKVILFVCAVGAQPTVECELYPSIQTFDTIHECAETYKRQFHDYVKELYEDVDNSVYVSCPTVEQVKSLYIEQQAFEKMPEVES